MDGQNSWAPAQQDNSQTRQNILAAALRGGSPTNPLASNASGLGSTDSSGTLDKAGNWLRNTIMGQSPMSGAALGGAGDAMAMSPLLGGGGAAGLAGWGGSTASSVLPGIFPGATVPLDLGAGTGAGIFGGGAGATAGAGAGAAGAEGAGAAGAGAAGAGLAGAMFMAPAAIAAYGLIMGALGKGDNGTPYTQANDAWANALLKNPSMIQQYGSGSVDQYMKSTFGGSSWTPAQYDQAKALLNSSSGGGGFFSNFLGVNDPGGGG